MKRFGWLLSLPLCLILFVGVAGAKDKGKKGGDEFDKLDKNNDGKVSLDEYKKAHPQKKGEKPSIESIFHKMDTQIDGMLTRSEWQAAMDKGNKKKKKS